MTRCRPRWRRWRHPLAVHDPAKVVLDLAVTLALGGDCLADIAVLRAEPDVYGRVASDPTVSRAIDRLAADAARGVDARSTPPAPRPAPGRGRWPGTRPRPRRRRRPAAGHRRGRHPGHRPLRQGRRRPDVQDAASASIRCGRSSTTARTAPVSRWRCCCGPGNAGSNTAADHITVMQRGTAPAARPPAGHRPGPQDPDPRRRRGRHPRVAGLAGRAAVVLLGRVHPARHDPRRTRPRSPRPAWQPAYDADGRPRPAPGSPRSPGCWTCQRWPAGMRVIVRKRAPAPRRAAAAHRRRRAPADRVRHQHRTRRAPATRRPRTAPPPPRPRRGPHPRRQGHRAAQPAAARARPEPDLVRDRRAGLRAHRLDADCSPSPSTPPDGGNPNGCGCGCSPSPGASPAPDGAPCCTCPAHAPWAGAARHGDHHPARLRRPRTDQHPPVPTTPHAGPWNRRPPERPRPNCHTPPPESALQDRPRPVKIAYGSGTKDL